MGQSNVMTGRLLVFLKRKTCSSFQPGHYFRRILIDSLLWKYGFFFFPANFKGTIHHTSRHAPLMLLCTDCTEWFVVVHLSSSVCMNYKSTINQAVFKPDVFFCRRQAACQLTNHFYFHHTVLVGKQSSFHLITIYFTCHPLALEQQLVTLF